MGPLLPSPGARGPEWEPGTPVIPRVGEPEAGGASGEGARRAGHSACGLAGAGRGLGGEGGHLELGLAERISPGARTPISAPAPPRPGLVLRADGHHSESPAGSQRNKRKLCVKFGAAAAGPPGRRAWALRGGSDPEQRLGRIAGAQLRPRLSPPPAAAPAATKIAQHPALPAAAPGRSPPLTRACPGSSGKPRRAFLSGPSGRIWRPRSEWRGTQASPLRPCADLSPLPHPRLPAERRWLAATC